MLTPNGDYFAMDGADAEQLELANDSLFYNLALDELPDALKGLTGSNDDKMKAFAARIYRKGFESGFSKAESMALDSKETEVISDVITAINSTKY